MKDANHINTMTPLKRMSVSFQPQNTIAANLRCVSVGNIPHQVANDQGCKRAQNSQDVGDTRLASGHIGANGCDDNRPDQAVVGEDVLCGLEVCDDGARHRRASGSQSKTELGPFEEFLESSDLDTKFLVDILWWKVVDVVC